MTYPSPMRPTHSMCRPSAPKYGTVAFAIVFGGQHPHAIEAGFAHRAVHPDDAASVGDHASGRHAPGLELALAPHCRRHCKWRTFCIGHFHQPGGAVRDATRQQGSNPVGDGWHVRNPAVQVGDAQGPGDLFVQHLREWYAGRARKRSVST